MAGTNKYDTEMFATARSGVNSAFSPDELPVDQVAWMLNGAIRDGKPHTRPPIRSLGYLPEGIIQGAGYFSAQNGMIILSVAGALYRLRIGERTFSYESIPLSFPNSPRLKEAWFCETVGSFLIQDGQSDCIIYDGASTRRAGYQEVPLGRQMAFGNGRLWVAINANQAVAGDIVTDVYQSELEFTENSYLAGGGSLSFPDTITGLQFSPMPNIAEYGPLLVFGSQFAKAIRADIASRDLWAQIPAFVSDVLRNIGAAGQKCIVPVNQDLYWRDSLGGIRSLSSALVDESDAGSTPLSREVSRITDFESAAYLATSSATYFDNRLLTLASPFLNPNGGVSFKNIISLDFAPISTMRAKALPAFDGQWSGAAFTQLITGKFNGRERCFGISSDDDGNNRLWEIHRRGVEDESEVGESPITCYLETSQRSFGLPKQRKKLVRCDVYLSSIEKEVDLQVYWRPDNQQKWLQWSEDVSVCAKMEDADVESVPHVWKNLASQYRAQVKTFTIPTETNDISKFAMDVVFLAQLRIKWVGKAKIQRVMLHASPIDDTVLAQHEVLSSECVYNDITGNSINYVIPIRIQTGRILTTEAGVDIITEGGLLLGAG